MVLRLGARIWLVASRLLLLGCAENYLLRVCRDANMLHTYVWWFAHAALRPHVEVCVRSYFRQHERFADAASLMRELAYEVGEPMPCACCAFG